MTPAAEPLILPMTEASVSVFRSTAIDAPLTRERARGHGGELRRLGQHLLVVADVAARGDRAASLTAARKPEVSPATTMSSSEMAFVASVTLSLAKEAVTPVDRGVDAGETR